MDKVELTTPALEQGDESQVAELVEAAKPFEEWYTSIQQHFTVQTEIANETEGLAIGIGNNSLPVHRWYNLKEAYSAQLPMSVYKWMRSRYGHAPIELLDPFIGGGTTGVALAQERVRVTGVEYNPFIRFVAAAKASIARGRVVELTDAIRWLERAPLTPSEEPLPELTTLQNRTYSTEEDVRLLIAARELISQAPFSEDTRILLLLGVAQAIEAVFALRKDGRALRYVPSLATRNTPVRKVLSANWRAILADICKHRRTYSERSKMGSLYELYDGSALNLNALKTISGEPVSLHDEQFDTILYSPPYLNNFDYSEIYKLELWLLGFVTQYSQWSELRKGTLRSHPSVHFPESERLRQDERTSAIAEKVTAMSVSPSLAKGAKYMGPVVRGYFDDMYLAFSEQWRVLKPGGMLAYAVANSRHHYLPIATDVVLGEIGRCIGFEPCDLIVLRHRNGRTRQKLFLRESIVFLRKPAG